MCLGTLGILPGEVRRLIWKDFVVPRTPVLQITSLRRSLANSTTKSSTTPVRRLAILESSKRICDEVTAELEQEYNSRVSFDLYPDQERIIVGNFPHLTFDDFRHTDFSIFKNIIVTIYPPDIRDPGQFVRLRNFVARLITLLRKSKTLPDIVVALRETGSALWHTYGMVNNSLADVTLARYFNGSDVEGLLDPFRTLRNMGSMTIQLPPGAEMSESVLQVVSCTETDILHRHAFEGDCLRHIDIGTILLDIELDRLEGPTASMVRWERFRYWDEYYRDIRETADRVKQYLRDVVHVESHLLDVSNDYDWFSDFQLHPFPDDPTWSPEDPWRWNYPNGIPPKETLEWDYAVLGREMYLTEEEEDRRRLRMDHYMETIYGESLEGTELGHWG